MSVFSITVKIEVIIENHIIIKIEVLKHDKTQGEEAEALVERVVLKQQLNLNVISRSTYSSKVILLAIEDALKP